MNYYAETNIGKVRAMNQDKTSVLVNSADQVLAIVCDGMGGHRAGEIASLVVEEYVTSSFKAMPAFDSEEEIKTWLLDTIITADEIVKKMAEGNRELEGMGTTIAMAVVWEDYAYIAHVGDSRVYLVDDDKLYQVTRDHTLVNQLIEMGAIDEEEAKTHAKRHFLLQAIGGPNEIKPSYIKVDVINKMLLICTDGMFHETSIEAMEKVLKDNVTVKDKVHGLINLAIENGGRDNISVALVDNKGGDING